MLAALRRPLALGFLAGCTPQSPEDGSLKVEPADPPLVAAPPAMPPGRRLPPIDIESTPAIDKPIEEMRANAIYMPDPSATDLARTGAARAKEPLVGIVSFCIGPSGKPTYVGTPSTGDAEVDVILRDVVTSWRFRPFTVEGLATKTCSAVEFQLAFDRRAINASAG